MGCPRVSETFAEDWLMGYRTYGKPRLSWRGRRKQGRALHGGSGCARCQATSKWIELQFKHVSYVICRKTKVSMKPRRDTRIHTWKCANGKEDAVWVNGRVPRVEEEDWDWQAPAVSVKASWRRETRGVGAGDNCILVFLCASVWSTVSFYSAVWYQTWTLGCKQDTLKNLDV